MAGIVNPDFDMNQRLIRWGSVGSGSSALRNAKNPPRSAPRGTSKEPSQSSLAAPRNAYKSVLRSASLYDFLNQDDIISSDDTTVVVTVNSYNQALLDSESLNQENQASESIDEEDVSTEHNENPPEVLGDEEEEAVTRLYIPSSEEIWMDRVLDGLYLDTDFLLCASSGTNQTIDLDLEYEEVLRSIGETYKNDNCSDMKSFIKEIQKLCENQGVKLQFVEIDNDEPSDCVLFGLLKFEEFQIFLTREKVTKKAAGKKSEGIDFTYYMTLLNDTTGSTLQNNVHALKCPVTRRPIDVVLKCSETLNLITWLTQTQRSTERFIIKKK